MTLAINPDVVAASIANLSISGVTIKDIDEIPDSVSLQCPLIIPQPNGFITAIESTSQSFGSLGDQASDFEYTLNYVFLFAEIGSGISAFTPYEPMIQKLVLIIEEILNNDVVTGLVDMKLESISNIGSIDDPAGNQFWGAFFSLRCLEFAK
jgi:hypothetical protein